VAELGELTDETEKIVTQGLLYDFYGTLLTEHQQKIYEMVVYDDYSLNEIAEAEGISKQAVHDLIRRTTGILMKFEKKLMLVKKFGRIEELCNEAEKSALNDNNEDLRVFAAKIKEELA
jgi:predicted DNA-binding protein YlxM (UPF0122 family)